MRAPLSRRPRPYVQPVNAGDGSCRRGVKAVTGQTPGQLIDLHYVNYGCDVERRMKNGSECRTSSLLLTLKLQPGSVCVCVSLCVSE